MAAAVLRLGSAGSLPWPIGFASNLNSEQTLSDEIRITVKTNGRRHFILPVLLAATRGAVISSSGPASIVIDGQSIERRPAPVMAPLRDFAEKLANVRF